MPTYEEPVEIRNVLDLAPAAQNATPGVSKAGQARFRYNQTTGAVQLSVNGGAYGFDIGAVTASAAELNVTDGLTSTAAELNKLDGVTGSVVEAHEVSFTETAGAGTYTGSVTVPAGATILDIIVNGVALWDNAGAVTMIVGDVADDNGYYTGIDLKATDLLAGESLSFSEAGGKAGAYIANNQVSPRYSASARTVSGIITTAGAGGTAGRTRMLVVFALPQSTTAATKA